jgi:ubiquinone/menaquinone biosynthesis C-methylase UbiE
MNNTNEKRREEHNVSAHEMVRSFYNKYGWIAKRGKSGEDGLFRQFPPAYRTYTLGSAERTLKCFQGRTGVLLLVGCGDMPETHIQLAKQFSQVYCMDISSVALDVTKEKLGESGKYLLESITETSLADNTVDAVYCAHVIYHIDKMLQERAISQLIRVTKPRGRIVVIYANPWSPFSIPGAIMRWMKRARKGARLGQSHFTNQQSESVPELYYHVNHLGWWRRFGHRCQIGFLPWEVIGSRPARALLWTDRMASIFFRMAHWMEAYFPRLSVRLWQYPIVILDKKSS